MTHARPTIESLEGRTLLAASAVPEHLRLARRLVAEVVPENNLYDTPTVITWRGLDGATTTTNTSVCSTLVTALMKKAYKYTSAQITSWTGESAPEAEDYYDAVVAGRGFSRITNIANLQPGDLFVAKYVVYDGTATGHVAIATAAPQLLSSTATERTYSLMVIDSSSSYHGTADTRYRAVSATEDDDGIGQGMMRMITDTNGLLIKYSWSTSSASIIYDATERPSLLARLPGVKPLPTGTPTEQPPPPKVDTALFSQVQIGRPSAGGSPTDLSSPGGLDQLVSPPAGADLVA
jgi:hypothetical protein